MSIYESLRTGMNDFGQGDRFHGYPRMPVLNADQPTQIVGLTPPDKRPSVETLNLMPPFDRFFVECKLPPELQFTVKTYGGGSNDMLDRPVVEIGLDVRIDREAKYESTPEELRPKIHLICRPYFVIDNPTKGTDPLCRSDFHIYIGLGEDGFPCLMPYATPEMLESKFRERGTAFRVDRDGQACCVMAQHFAGTDPKMWKDLTEQIFKQGNNDLSTLFKQTTGQFVHYLPLLYAINSLHNKRTVLSTVQHSRQVRRAAQRNNQQPPDQKTIDIKDFVTIMQGARKARAEGCQYPLGEVIGHYKTYGRGGKPGLFGKYAGTWFWSSFLRGNPDKGATDHDYVLKCKGVAA